MSKRGENGKGNLETKRTLAEQNEPESGKQKEMKRI